MSSATVGRTLLHARALVLHDLQSCDRAYAVVVDMVENAVAGRRWWIEQWPAGAAYIPGLVAQDVQEAMLESVGRWPLCPHHLGEDAHELELEPELGADPHWVCHREGVVIAPLGGL